MSATGLGAVLGWVAAHADDQASADGQQSDSSGAQGQQVPPKAKDVLDYIRKHNGTPPPNYKGGRAYDNNDGKFPPGDYKEYDVDLKTKGVPRNTERLIVNTKTVRHIIRRITMRHFTPSLEDKELRFLWTGSSFESLLRPGVTY
jgi:ribonuclease T1